MHIQCVCLIVL